MISKWLRRKNKQWKKIKFSKKIVVFCIIFVILYTIAQTYLSYVLGIELSPTLTTCVYAFFGTELAASAVIRIFDKEDKEILKKSNKSKYDEISVG